MDLDHEDLNASRLFLLPVLVLLVIFVCLTFSIHFHRLRRIRLHGCAPPPNLPQIDPVFGLDTVIQAFALSGAINAIPPSSSNSRLTVPHSRLKSPIPPRSTRSRRKIYSQSSVLTLTPGV